MNLLTNKSDWDDFTERHFQAWLDFTCSIDERDEVENNIRNLHKYDSTLIDSGFSWPEMRDLAERNKK